MDQIKVDIVAVKFAQTIIESRARVVVGVIGEFGRNKDLVAFETAGLERPADALLIAVHGCRINVPIASLQGCCPRGLGLVARGRLKDAQPQLRYLYLVI